MVDFSKASTRGTIDANLEKDLRGTHYNFGQDKNDYLS